VSKTQGHNFSRSACKVIARNSDYQIISRLFDKKFLLLILVWKVRNKHLPVIRTLFVWKNLQKSNW